jgi:DNA-binding LytR/AlgR family response regulator
MPFMDGLETGHRIRCADKDVIIIVVTGFEEYMPDSFEIKAFDFIMKPIDDKKFCKVLKRAYIEHEEKHLLVKVGDRDSAHFIRVSDLVYLEKRSWSVQFVTKDEVKHFDVSLADYESKLSPYGFFRSHNKCLVNMSYIDDIGDNCIITSLGHTVKMSVRRRKGFMRAYNHFRTRYLV